MNLPEKFLHRMKERLGTDYPAFLSSYENPPCKGLRVNTLKISKEEFLKISPFPLAGIPWEENGFYIQEEKAGGYVEHFAGLYYLQEPSAMSVGNVTKSLKKERVLDLCAAPGGKTTLVAAQMQGEGVLIANEIDKARAKILSQNVERMGVKNCAVISAAPDRLSRQFPEYFDLILVDAPCSGEGMFKKEVNAVPEWSEENVKRCAERQSGILDEAAKMLSGGGAIVYSTCTFAEEEDEWQVRAFLERHPAFKLEEEEKYYPHKVKGEGHYCALLKKTEGGAWGSKPYPVMRNAQANKAFSAFAEDFLQTPLKGEITTLPDGRMYLLPMGMPLIDAYVLRLGVELGEWDGKLFKPAHALAMALGTYAKRKVKLPREEAEKYLRGETVEAEIENGWCAVCFEEYPLGLAKAVNGTLKNHLPKGLRKVKSVK